MAKIVTPLRYPGGKSCLSGFIKLIIAKNDLMDGDYAEPFCGGAGVAFELLNSEFVQRVHLNDVDPAIHAFWWCVFNETEEVCRRIRSFKISIHNWRRQRAILKRGLDESPLDLGFAAFFLNRVNRSGILSAGPIGGVEQSGNWEMDARFNRETLSSQIQSIARFKDRVNLYRLDAVDFIELVAKKLPSRSLVYADPPYVVKGKRLYLNAYEREDHAVIANVIQTMVNRHWIVSYDNEELIRDLYSKRKQLTYRIGYSANQRSSGSEIIVFSDKLKTPNIESPLSIYGSRLKKLLKAA